MNKTALAALAYHKHMPLLWESAESPEENTEQPQQRIRGAEFEQPCKRFSGKIPGTFLISFILIYIIFSLFSNI